ncbi:hypothetical protein [Vibrio vulnificus]|uniref:hypothetical protein n=1 Tax=Vibrio vulnificus TaxID=672 RepID=UPI00071F7241|nr:hypothetical protein [Vibrio vulnificus]ALM71484.1 hypothetical protein FORC9_1967 [Vibrio vulnificus]ANH62714.1 hypothetical protein FORC16_0831 [Vibrio vulnificus]EGR0046248.1 hypothetical protein [Vibrio vulnificus]
MKTFKIFISICLTLLLVGCGRVQPILEIQDTPVSYDLQSKQVKSAIVLAATKRGWAITEVEPGVLSAKLNLRSHFVEIMIPYDDKYYSILYVKSENLNASDGNIHRNYNRWINNLNVDIQRQFALVAAQ